MNSRTGDSADGAVLHLLFSAESGVWLQCNRLSNERDQVVIGGPAVSVLLRAGFGEGHGFSCPVRVLGADATAIGGEQAAEMAGINLISDSEFVRLTEQHARILSWT